MLPFTIGISQILVAAMGVVVGIIFGAIPGMTATMAVAVFLPLTYAYDLETALYLLLGLYVGGISGGLIPAILINIPGTPSSITTTFDGYPMAKRGAGERALKVGIVSSFVGGIISLIALALFTPLLSAARILSGHRNGRHASRLLDLLVHGLLHPKPEGDHDYDRSRTDHHAQDCQKGPELSFFEVSATHPQ